jgi:phosphate:Na+ symporter
MSNELNLAPMLALIAGGLALFGLELLPAGLKAAAGSGLQAALGKLTANRFRGLLAGAFVTALLNSSTITTVLMVGFVSAGLMTLNQTVPMIMGANIGSTITAQIIAFHLSALTPVILAVGFLLRAVGRPESLRHLGGTVLGFGLLFLGIQFMGDDLARPRDDNTSEFVEAVVYNLEQAIATIEQSNQTQVAEVLAAKGRIQNLADSVRTSLLSKLRLSEKKDAETFSLATDMIEQFKQIAHFARQIAAVTRDGRGKAVSNSAKPQRNRTDSEQQSKVIART